MSNNEEIIELSGKVIEVVRKNIKVELENGHVIMAYPAGKLRKNNIKVIVGDKVDVAISPYDLTKGRITWRHK